MPHDTWLSFCFGDHEHVVYNTEQMSWNEFVARTPFLVASIGVSFFFINSRSRLDDFMEKMEFIRNNVTIDPTNKADYKIHYQPGISGEQWLPKTDQEIRARIRARDVKNMAEVRGIDAAEMEKRLMEDALKKIVPEEKWACPNCGCDWPVSAVQEEWKMENRCDACG